jgi:hypothetical protein
VIGRCSARMVLLGIAGVRRARRPLSNFFSSFNFFSLSWTWRRWRPEAAAGGK